MYHLDHGVKIEEDIQFLREIGFGKSQVSKNDHFDTFRGSKKLIF